MNLCRQGGYERGVILLPLALFSFVVALQSSTLP